VRAAHLANLLHDIVIGCVNRDIRAKALCEFQFVIGDVDRDHLSSETLRDLDGQMTQASHAKHNKSLSRLDPRALDGVIDSYAGAKKRRSLL
jgi:hypothetical protein